MNATPTDRSGFTLVEVMVAAVVTAVVVSLATAMVGTVGDTLRRLEEHTLAHHRSMNSVRWLQHVLPSVDLDRRGGEGFSGAATSASLTAWSWAANGWLERHDVRLAAGESGLTVEIAGTPSVTAFEGRRVRLAYLVERPDGREWVAAWESAVSPPLAVRFTLTDPDSGTTEAFVVPMGAGP